MTGYNARTLVYADSYRFLSGTFMISSSRLYTRSIYLVLSRLHHFATVRSQFYSQAALSKFKTSETSKTSGSGIKAPAQPLVP